MDSNIVYGTICNIEDEIKSWDEYLECPFESRGYKPKSGIKKIASRCNITIEYHIEEKYIVSGIAKGTRWDLNEFAKLCNSRIC